MNGVRCWCQRQLARSAASAGTPAVRYYSTAAPSSSSSVSPSSPGAAAGPNDTPSAPAPTSRIVALLKSQPEHLYATVLIMNRRYLVTKNDIVTVPQLKDVSPGQTIDLTRVLEVGSRDYTLRPTSSVTTTTTTTTATANGDGIVRPVTAHNIDASLGRSNDTASTDESPQRSTTAKDWQRYPDSLPYLSTSVVNASATVIEHTKGAMFEVEKFKKRKGYRRHLRFKLGWTKLRINAINLV